MGYGSEFEISSTVDLDELADALRDRIVDVDWLVDEVQGKIDVEDAIQQYATYTGFNASDISDLEDAIEGQVDGAIEQALRDDDLDATLKEDVEDLKAEVRELKEALGDALRGTLDRQARLDALEQGFTLLVSGLALTVESAAFGTNTPVGDDIAPLDKWGV